MCISFSCKRFFYFLKHLRIGVDSMQCLLQVKNSYLNQGAKVEIFLNNIYSILL